MKTQTIRPAQAGDLEQIMLMYEHSRGIMRSNGNDSQWANGYPSPTLVADDVARGRSWLIESDGECDGVFTFIVGRDPTYETIVGGRWENDGRPYGTIHRIACAPSRHGIFAACLEWCRQQTTSIRIDTHADNAIMLKLIKRHGFKYSGIIHVDDGTPRHAFQLTNTGTVCRPLKKYVEQAVLPQYDHFDTAHQRDHADRVIESSLELALANGLDVNIAYTAASYHDIGLQAGRERHHLASGEMVRNDAELGRWFSDQDIEIIAEAAEDHRASIGHRPRSMYGMVVAEADRDIDPLKIVRRTVQYGTSHYPELDKESHWKRAVEHLQEKYAEGGYMKLWFPNSKNAKQLSDLRRIIADREQLRVLFEEYYKMERGEI